MSHAEIVQACRDLVLAITQHADHGEADAAAALFADGGVLNRGGREFTGQADLIAAYRDPPSRVVRHLNGGTVVSVVDDHHASAVTYYLAYRHDTDGGPVELPARLEQPFSVGEWHDRFVLTDAGWRFASRQTRRVFAQPVVSGR
jgi:hypothetical protein